MAETVSSLVIPAVLLLTTFFMLSGKKDYLSVFINGAKEGLRCAAGLIPTMVLLCSALSMFRASGAAQWLSELLSPLGDLLGIPAGLFTLILTRPLSGGAANASLADVAPVYGADSFEAFAGAVIMASSDTLIYIICVYFSATRVKNTRYAFPCAVCAAILSLFAALCCARAFY